MIRSPVDISTSLVVVTADNVASRHRVMSSGDDIATALLLNWPDARRRQSQCWNWRGGSGVGPHSCWCWPSQSLINFLLGGWRELSQCSTPWMVSSRVRVVSSTPSPVILGQFEHWTILAVSAPSVWNNIPDAVRVSVSLDTFKAVLTHVFNCTYKQMHIVLFCLYIYWCMIFSLYSTCSFICCANIQSKFRLIKHLYCYFWVTLSIKLCL